MELVRSAALKSVVDLIEQPSPAEDRDRANRLAAIKEMFRFSRESVMITDANGEILEVNQLFLDCSGYSREEVLGRTPRILHSGRHDQAFYKDMWDSITETGGWVGNICNRRKSGEEYEVASSIFSIKDDSQNRNEFFVCQSSLVEGTADKSKESVGRISRSIDFRFLEKRVLGAMFRAKRLGKTLCVCHIDLNGFSLVNQQHGRDAGDLILDAMNARLSQANPPPAVVIRHDSDEFLLLVEDIDDAAGARQAVENTLRTIRDPLLIECDEKTIKVSLTASIGAALYPSIETDDPCVLLLQAQRAASLAKADGANNYKVFDVQESKMFQWRSEVFQSFDSALRNNDLCLYYQPKINIESQRVIGFEALIRWLLPTPVATSDFLPIIGGTYAEVSLGQFVIREVMRQMDTWQKQGISIPVSINIAPGHLSSGQLVLDLKQALADYPDVPPENLEIEVLENSSFNDISTISRLIEECMALGVNFSIDDFGSGYSSLLYLKHLPVSTIKIDKSFVLDMVSSYRDLAIVKHIIDLGESFGRKVIAEGAETEGHLRALHDIGCFGAQGFGIAHPMPSNEVSEWMRTWECKSRLEY